MSSSRKRLGDWGERIAAEKLRADGYEIVAQNWRCAQGEIDIVARQQDEIAFVEVKTRRGRSHGTPEEAITPHKARKLLELAQWYCRVCRRAFIQGGAGAQSLQRQKDPDRRQVHNGFDGVGSNKDRQFARRIFRAGKVFAH